MGDPRWQCLRRKDLQANERLVVVDGCRGREERERILRCVAVRRESNKAESDRRSELSQAESNILPSRQLTVVVEVVVGSTQATMPGKPAGCDLEET